MRVLSITDMILAIKSCGMSAKDIARWGEKRGRTFSALTINSIVSRQSSQVRRDIEQTIRELYERLCG